MNFLFYFSARAVLSSVSGLQSDAGGATGVDSPSGVAAFAEPLWLSDKVSPSLLPMMAALTSLAVDSVSFDSLRSGDLGFLIVKA